MFCCQKTTFKQSLIATCNVLLQYSAAIYSMFCCQKTAFEQGYTILCSNILNVLLPKDIILTLKFCCCMLIHNTLQQTFLKFCCQQTTFKQSLIATCNVLLQYSAAIYSMFCCQKMAFEQGFVTTCLCTMFCSNILDVLLPKDNI